MKIRPSIRIPILAAALSLTGCMSVGPDYQRPAAPTPQRYKELGDWKPIEPRPAASDLAWWTIYNDSKLDELERQVAVSNESLKASEANYRQALELVNEARAGYWPTVSANASGQRARVESSPPGSHFVYNQVNPNLGASWAPDIWGKIRRTVESSRASAQASGADLAAARLSLQTTLATDYFALRIDDELKHLYEETVKAYEATLEITRNQFEAGTAAETDVITAETQLQGEQAQLIGIGVQRAQLEHAIAVLIGKTPDQFSIEPATFSRAVPVVPAGVPSALLERRPDIAAAERAAAAASAQIGVAIAAYFPSISLTGTAGFSGSELSGLFAAANYVWAAGAQASELLFDAGLRSAQVGAARATYDASVASYRQTALSAFQQVEDEIAALRILEQEEEVLKRTVESARQAVQLTIYQYEAGTVAYTAVVTVQAIALADEQNLLTTLGNEFGASVALVSALGGGWNSAMLAEEGATTPAGGAVH
ncbi:MAG TPA: efflux transporter outer membrane subunit [Burkholderiaceae bacterium]|nr:efflux transporter outer membrane subunit [Burkholderiaceae bacterium]